MERGPLFLVTREGVNCMDRVALEGGPIIFPCDPVLAAAGMGGPVGHPTKLHQTAKSEGQGDAHLKALTVETRWA